MPSLKVSLPLVGPKRKTTQRHTHSIYRTVVHLDKLTFNRGEDNEK